MSGIYIPGMEMPKSCWDCFACHDGWCIINQKIEGHRTVTHSCPLIAVPDHGRLIDADVLVSHCKEMEQIEWNNKTAPYSWAYAYESLEDDIDNAKTIIPADKDGDS